MDGNRRWAEARNLKPWDGHREGVKIAEETLRWLSETNVNDLALYVFSSENWKRSPEEVQALMNIFLEIFSKHNDTLDESGFRARFIGDLKKLPFKIQKAIRETEEATKHFSKTVWVCVSYGGRDEIQAAARKPSSWFGGLSKNLWSADMPDLDLVIRTGGGRRLSNFLLWKSAYAELLFTDTLWPDMTKELLFELLEEGSGASKNLGA